MFHYFYYQIIECQLFYSSAIGNEETLESFELHICVKDYCFARDDALVGVAVMQLKDIVEQVKIKYKFQFDWIWIWKMTTNVTGFLRLLVGFGQALPHGRNWLDDLADLVTTHKRRSGSRIRQNEIGSKTWRICRSTTVVTFDKSSQEWKKNKTKKTKNKLAHYSGTSRFSSVN